MLQEKQTQCQKLLNEAFDLGCNTYMIKFITRMSNEDLNLIVKGVEDLLIYRKLLGLCEFLKLGRKQIEHALILLSKKNPRALFECWQAVTGTNQGGLRKCS